MDVLLLISTEFLAASAGVGSWYGNANPRHAVLANLRLLVGCWLFSEYRSPHGQKIDTRGSGVPPIFECQITSYERPPSGEGFEKLSLRSVQILRA